MHVEDLDRGNEAAARTLILAGLADHWGNLDESLNPDLVDLVGSYQAGRTVLICDGDGVAVGTGTVMPRSAGIAEILRMSVASSVRRRGIGRQIVEELLGTARDWGATTVVLETTSTWDEAIEFYLRCGFTITHVEDGAFGGDIWFERQLGGGSD